MIGFCVCNKRYEKRVNYVIDNLFKKLKNKNINFYIYTNEKIKTNYEVRALPKIEFDFKSRTEYDSFMPLLLAKLKIFSDLSKIDRVFNIDLDIEIHKDLSEIFDRYTDEKLYGCLEDTNYYRLYDRRKQILKALNITEFEYINAGFMIMNFKYDFDLNEVKEFFSKYPFSNCPEQDFLNWKFKDKICVMPNHVNWNRLLPFEMNPYITHYLGFPKPFNL